MSPASPATPVTTQPSMKGIIMAGGSGTRLYPITQPISKQLLPVYDKPMIYYPLTTLMLAGIREILVIATPHDLPNFRVLLGDGDQWGIKISYLPQPHPEGIAQAFVIGRDFVGNDSVALVLGDNIFYGGGFQRLLGRISKRTSGATIFGVLVRNPQRYGVVSLNKRGQVIDIEEKPQHPRSRYAVPGCYFYDNRVLSIAAGMKPSPRGELEITDVNRAYLDLQELHVFRFTGDLTWFDAGTPDSLLESSQFVAAVEKRQNLKIGCPEEVAYRQGFINYDQLMALAKGISNEYGDYLRNIQEVSVFD